MKKGFNEKEGPFVKRLDSALQEFGVQRNSILGVHLLEITFTKH